MKGYIGRMLARVDEQEYTDVEPVQDFAVAPLSLIERNIAKVDSVIDDAHRHEEQLQATIDDATERLRQTRVTRKAFELAKAELEAGRQ